MKSANFHYSIWRNTATANRPAAAISLSETIWRVWPILLVCLCATAQAQIGEWAWMSGSNTVPPPYEGQQGTYGTLGVPSTLNSPGGRSNAVTWVDGENNLWLFGGVDPNG